MTSLQDRVAIVTGGGSGIGRAICMRYAKAGARVVVGDIDADGGAETVSMVQEAGGTAFFVLSDTGTAAGNQKLVEEAVGQFGALHIACNNAGIGGPMGTTGEYPLAGWDRVIAINLSGVFYGMHYQLAEISKAGGGVIINMASILGFVATSFSPAYVAAKHGVVGLTKAAALEYAKQGIRINAVGPGYVMTPLLTKNLEEAQLSSLVGLHPIGRLGEPEEVANLVLWLSSDEASFVTGSYYTVDGGYTAQ